MHPITKDNGKTFISHDGSVFVNLDGFDSLKSVLNTIGKASIPVKGFSLKTNEYICRNVYSEKVMDNAFGLTENGLLDLKSGVNPTFAAELVALKNRIHANWSRDEMLSAAHALIRQDRTADSEFIIKGAVDRKVQTILYTSNYCIKKLSVYGIINNMMHRRFRVQRRDELVKYSLKSILLYIDTINSYFVASEAKKC